MDFFVHVVKGQSELSVETTLTFFVIHNHYKILNQDLLTNQIFLNFQQGAQVKYFKDPYAVNIGIRFVYQVHQATIVIFPKKSWIKMG